MLDAAGTAVRSERSSRKEPLSDKEVRQLLRAVSWVVVSKGKRSKRIQADKAKLADLKGPTGNYRAPMVRKGKTLLVGFNREELEKLV